LYCKPESGKKWKDVNCGSCQQGKSLYSSFIYRLKFDFGRFFRGLMNGFGMFASERHSDLGERRSHDYRVTGL
jgi:hypothetical protein